VRVALDTNVVVSALATRGLCADLLRLALAEHTVVLGETVLSETARVLRIKFRFPPDQRRALDGMLRRHADVVPAAQPLAIATRDPDDRAVLAEAVAGAADVLVTGDRDLIDVAGRAPLPILTPRQFWEQLRSR
jgi:putative PIN family toxin of toxin-antitoxin system